MKISEIGVVRQVLNGKYSKDFISFALGFFLTSFIALGTTVVINKSLEPSELGELTFYKSMFEMLSYGLTLLIYRSYLRFNVPHVNESLVKKVRFISIFAILALSVICFTVTKSIYSILFSLFILYEERLYFFRSTLSTKKLNILRIGAALITFVSILYLKYFANLDSNLILFSYGLGFTIALFLLKSKRKDQQTDAERIPLKTILLFSIPGLVSTFIKSFQDFFSQFMIKESFDFNEVSKFSIALRVILVVKLFSSLLMMYYPSVYFRELKNKNSDTISRIRMFLVIFMLIVCSFAILFSRHIYILMGAKDYLEYVFIFWILVVSEFIALVGSIYGTFLAYAIKTYLSMIIYIFSTIINVSILFLFLDKHGIIVTALAILVSNSIILLFHILVSRKMELNYLKAEVE